MEAEKGPPAGLEGVLPSGGASWLNTTLEIVLPAEGALKAEMGLSSKLEKVASD